MGRVGSVLNLSMKSGVFRVIGTVVFVGVLGGLTGGWGVPAWVRYRLTSTAEHADRPSDRQKALYALAKRREGAAGATMRRALQHDPAADVREAAAYALYKVEAPDAVDALSQAVGREPDNVQRAKMVVYYARLCGPDALPVLDAWTQSNEPWKSTGAALARIEFGDVEAGGALIERLSGPDAFLAAHITEQFRPTLETMTELIGRPIDLDVHDGRRWSADQVLAIRHWWDQFATATLLGDAVSPLTSRNAVRRDLARLGSVKRRALRYLRLE